jgi:hypothetical protein
MVRQDQDPILRVVDHLPAQNPGPEARESYWVVRIEDHRVELQTHPARISHLLTGAIENAGTARGQER